MIDAVVRGPQSYLTADESMKFYSDNNAVEDISGMKLNRSNKPRSPNRSTSRSVGQQSQWGGKRMKYYTEDMDNSAIKNSMHWKTVNLEDSTTDIKSDLSS